METISAQSIIARSLQEHPTLFRNRVERQLQEHRDYLKGATIPEARNGAAAQIIGCESILAAMRDESNGLSPEEGAAWRICQSMAPMIVALNIAAKLQGLPAHVRTQAAIAWDAARAAASTAGQ